jgi:hypothetical protein
MKNKILGIFLSTLLVLVIAIPTVYAVSTNGNSNSTNENGNSDTAATKAEERALAAEKRVLIKTQKEELAGLREELKAKIALKKTELNQYREQEELTEEDREDIEETTETMEQLGISLGIVYGNAIKAMKSYKGDASENKLTGLDLVIASQQERIKLLEEAIELLS